MASVPAASTASTLNSSVSLVPPVSSPAGSGGVPPPEVYLRSNLSLHSMDPADFRAPRFPERL